jgi:2-dehydropantoate 2-reductase
MENSPRPKIVIYGAGAVGGVIGSLLARAGENVTLIARGEHVRAIRSSGLSVSGASGAFTVHPQMEEQLSFQPDLVLLTVKMGDVEESCRQINARAPGATVATFQNGVRGDELAAGILGKENVVGGVALFNAAYLAAGRVRYGTKGSLLVGEPFRPNGARIREIAAVRNCGIKTGIASNIAGAHWTKLLVNVMGNSLEAMTGLSFGECMKRPGLRRIAIRILREALDVLDTSGIPLEPLPDLPVSAFRMIGRWPEGIASGLLGLTMSGTRTLTSTLQSIRKGRPTEIDCLNGEIVRQGAAISLPTPYNAKAVELIHEVERSGRFFSADYLEGSAFA